MIYKLTNVTLDRVPKGKENEGQVYVHADFVNPNDLFDGPSRQAIFDEALIRKFQEFFSVTENGTSPTNMPIPEELLVFKGGRYEQFVFPETMVMLNEDGTPRRNPRNGNLYRRDGITVLCKFTVDNETGERRYAHGWDPISRGTRIMNSMFAPLSKFKMPTVAPPQLINDRQTTEADYSAIPGTPPPCA